MFWESLSSVEDLFQPGLLSWWNSFKPDRRKRNIAQVQELWGYAAWRKLNGKLISLRVRKSHKLRKSSPIGPDDISQVEKHLMKGVDQVGVVPSEALPLSLAFLHETGDSIQTIAKETNLTEATVKALLGLEVLECAKKLIVRTGERAREVIKKEFLRRLATPGLRAKMTVSQLLQGDKYFEEDSRPSSGDGKSPVADPSEEERKEKIRERHAQFKDLKKEEKE